MRRLQRGVAAITAILIVAVAASAATMMLSQQSALLDQTMLVASRAQADVYAQAGLEWARGVLLQDMRGGSSIDTLDEGWARPIAGMPIERAVVAGDIADEQGKFNLNNVMNGTRRSEEDIKLLRALLASLGLSPDLADAVVDWVDGDDDLTGGGGAENAYYLGLPRPYRAANAPMVQVDELYRVRGFDAAAVAKLRPYVTALPVRTAINANTAPDLVIAAAFGVPREKVAELLAGRLKAPFGDPGAFTAALQRANLIAVNTFDVKSAWFSVRIQVQQDDVVLGSEALVQRDPAKGAAIIWRRTRY
jgi:general secretion pathway protein K